MHALLSFDLVPALDYLINGWHILNDSEIIFFCARKNSKKKWQLPVFSNRRCCKKYAIFFELHLWLFSSNYFAIIIADAGKHFYELTINQPHLHIHNTVTSLIVMHSALKVKEKCTYIIMQPSLCAQESQRRVMDSRLGKFGRDLTREWMTLASRISHLFSPINNFFVNQQLFCQSITFSPINNLIANQQPRRQSTAFSPINHV